MSLSAFDQYARPRLAPSNDIEDRFTSAVKSALDGSKAAEPPSKAATVSVREERPKRSRVWAIALLCLAFAAVAAVVAAALHVRRSNVTRFVGEIAAMRPGGTASNQPNPTVVAPANATVVAPANATVVAHESTAASESTAAASNLTTTTAPQAPTAAVSSLTPATPSAFAASPSGASTATPAGVTPTAEGETAAALAPTADVSSTRTQPQAP